MITKENRLKSKCYFLNDEMWKKKKVSSIILFLQEAQLFSGKAFNLTYEEGEDEDDGKPQNVN